MQTKKIHLVLGSGGARGIAHIGVIEALLKEGYQIVSVSGCSMGALVGGMYCAGRLPEFKDWLLSLDKMAVFNLIDFTFTTHGFIKGEKVLNAIRDITGEYQIESLPIPLTIVATDLHKGEEVQYHSGSLFQAIRASVGIPTFFVPVTEQQTVLVDGAVLNPLPLSTVVRKRGESIVAVNVSASAKSELAVINNISNNKLDYKERMVNLFFDKLTGYKKPSKKKAADNQNLFTILDRSVELMQNRLTDMIIEKYQPDYVVNISRNICNAFEFYKAEELIAEGHRACCEALHL